MATTTVRHGDSEIVIRSETRGTALKRSRYLRYVAESRDEFKGFALYTSMIMFSAQAASGQIGVDEGTAYQQLSEFCSILSQIAETRNAPFVVKHEAEYLPKEEVLRIFDLYMNDETSLWDSLINAVYELSVPSTPPDQRPADTLTKDEKADPNS